TRPQVRGFDFRNFLCNQELRNWSSLGKVDMGLKFIPPVRPPPGRGTPARSTGAWCCRTPRSTRRSAHAPPPGWRSPRRGPTPSASALEAEFLEFLGKTALGKDDGTPLAASLGHRIVAGACAEIEGYRLNAN